jgi:EpsI family protein
MPEGAAKPTTVSFGSAVLAAGAAAVVWVLIRFWGANPEYVDRFLILAASVVIAWMARPELRALESRPVLSGYVPLLFGIVAFPVGWFLQSQVGPKPVVMWWLAGSWVLAAVGTILVSAGWSHLRRLAFPLAFVLFALPIPNRILVPLQYALQSATTSTAAAALPALGVPVERNGFVLRLPNGDLGVAEACSGVRSVTALTAIAAFVAWWRGFGFVRGVLLVVLSVPVIATVNAVRVIVSGLLQEHVGQEYVRGQWHEGLGIAMVFLGLGLIVGLASLLGRSANAESGGEVKVPPPVANSWRSPRLAMVLLALGAAATITAQFLGVEAEQELVASAPLEQIPLRIGRWEGIERPVPEEISAMLTSDAMIHRVYQDLGYEIHIWVIYWSSRNMVKGYHHPDVCWPNRGFRAENREIVPLAAGGGTLPVTVREFSRGSDRQLILYWTQEGRRVWTEDDEKRVQAAGDSHDWLGERLFQRGPQVTTGRLVVLIGTAAWGDNSAIRSQTLSFTAKLADEVFKVCPWAAPPN